MTIQTHIIGLEPKFQLGEIVATTNCYNKINDLDRATALTRHAQGDWGEICDHDRKQNAYALEHGSRLMSVYDDRDSKRFWIITESDRSVTTLLMPEDY